jgi:SNF2 family DNA or RNA helicase
MLLKFIYSDIKEIFEEFAKKNWDDPIWQNLRLEVCQLQLEEQDEHLLSIDQIKDRIQLFPHQIKTALKVKNNMCCRAILADEVGLGKTIEAGIIIKEYICRNLVKKILILTPATLTFQWKEELIHKFSEEFIVANSHDSKFKRLDLHDKLIVSLDLAKREINSERLKDIRWDLLVVDEAHRLKSRSSLAHKFVRDIDTRYFLMLTATPIQNNLLELYNLINLLRPTLLGTPKEFKKNFISDKKARNVKDHKVLQHILSQAIIRTNKSEVKDYLKFTERYVRSIRIKSTKNEKELYYDLTQYVRKKYFEALNEGESGQATIFSLMTLQRQITSSSAAVIKALQEKIKNGKNPADLLELSCILNKTLEIQLDSKISELLKIIQNLKSKVLIFTTFIETQKMIAKKLDENGFSVSIFHGQMSYQEKEEAINNFKEDVQVLICTDAGSEGRNLQFCNIVMNYDIPWNPMKVEQRIGRIHRIGQEKDVFIYNFVTEDTIEDYILKILYEKIRMFQLTIGDLELILGDELINYEHRIFENYMNSINLEDLKNRLGILGDDFFKKRSIADDIIEFDHRVFKNFDLSPLSKV